MGGETAGSAVGRMGASGLSPRGRGNPHRTATGAPSAGSIPAWAGKPLADNQITALQEVYPRVGGETVTTGAK